MTTRGKAVLSALGAVVLLGGVVVGYLMFTGNTGAIPFIGGDRGPTDCPLTGEEAANERLAGRTPVAVKVENTDQARPQAGLNQADVVYEEPVEGGITRFVAVYHCANAPRVGPIRSARFADPVILTQLGDPVFGYSGAAGQVIDSIARTGAIQDVGFDNEPDLYETDPNRSAPHNLYSSIQALLGVAETRNAPPEPIFEFDDEPPAREGSRRARQIHLDFSPAADVFWSYRPQRGVYARAHGEIPHTLEDGSEVEASNIAIMVVELRDSGIVDAAGNPSPDVQVIGSGPAYVIRDGRVIQGTWERGGRDDVTRFLDRDGDVIPFAPGRTWVELFPSDREVEIG